MMDAISATIFDGVQAIRRRYGASLGGQKTLKRNILRVFWCPIYKYLRWLLVNDTS